MKTKNKKPKKVAITPKVAKSIKTILNYLFDEERKHYEEMCESEGTPQESHIFHDVERVKEWLGSIK